LAHPIQSAFVLSDPWSGWGPSSSQRRVSWHIAWDLAGSARYCERTTPL